MKVVLNPQITKILEEIQKQFPEGTAMTHIVNVAVNSYYKQISSTNKDGINEKLKSSDALRTNT